MCLAFPHYTANEWSKAGPLGGRVPISQNKNQNEQKWKSVQDTAGAGQSTGAGDSTAVLLTLFSNDSPERKKKQNKLTSSSSIVKLKHVEFELCCTRIEVEWRAFCFYACTAFLWLSSGFTLPHNEGEGSRGEEELRTEQKVI